MKFLLSHRSSQNTIPFRDAHERFRVSVLHADDTTDMAESENKLKSLLMRMKEESAKIGLTLNIKKTKFMESGPIASHK